MCVLGVPFTVECVFECNFEVVFTVKTHSIATDGEAHTENKHSKYNRPLNVQFLHHHLLDAMSLSASLFLFGCAFLNPFLQVRHWLSCALQLPQIMLSHCMQVKI
jgi:hypothetical protein